ncbi:MAG: VanZ family protein [Rhodoferax sp.]|nr:VanZ family protein [Rhodoferax sp.]
MHRNLEECVLLNRFRLSRIVGHLAFWGLLALTVVLSLLPTEQLPGSLMFWDKAQHALGFAALAMLGQWAYPQDALRMRVGLLLLGAGIEYVQALTGWRQGDWLDWLADAFGIAMAAGAMAVWMRWRSKAFFTGTVES